MAAIPLMGCSAKSLTGLVWRWARPSWPLAAGAVTANLAAALFEGLTLGCLSLAVHAVGGPTSWSAPIPLGSLAGENNGG